MNESVTDPLRRGSYAHWRSEHIRYGDLDTNGHVNNIAFLVYSESGLVPFLAALGHPVDHRETPWMTARIEIDLRAQLHYPGEVDIGTRVLGLGRSSLTLGQGLFSGESCAATLRRVMVLVDRAAGGAREIPADLRARLTTFAAP